LAFAPYLRSGPAVFEGAAAYRDAPKATMMGVERHVADAHEDGIWSCVWTPRGQIVTGSVDENCSVWDAKTLENKQTFKNNYCGVVSCVADSTGGVVATSSIDSVLRFWDVDSGALKSKIDAGPVEAWTLSLHPDDKTVCSGTQKGTVNVWDVETSQRKGAFKNAVGDDALNFVMSVAYSPGPDGAHIATADISGHVCILDAKSGQRVAIFEGDRPGEPAHAGPIRSICWTPDSQILLTAGDDTKVRAFDVTMPGKAFHVFEGHASWAAWKPTTE